MTAAFPIVDLPARVAWWRRHHVVPCQGPSPAHPFEALDEWRDRFAGRDALEIGPGEGRQAAVLMPLARSYTVADIVPDVLDRALYAQARRVLLRGYAAADLGRRFDVVSFWYVVHHVRADELEDFLAFVARHTAPGGDLFFNIPGPAPTPTLLADGPGDGMKTTPHRPEAVRALLEGHGFAMVDERVQDFSSHVMLFRSQH